MVLESAQKSLIASTENLHSDAYSQMTDQDLAAELERLGIEPAVHSKRTWGLECAVKGKLLLK